MSAPKHPYNGWMFLNDNGIWIIIAIGVLISGLPEIVKSFTCP
jgi:hypothetical protein